jgi:uncharacterized SAM-binding protein YcdF (DUF218 family)
MFYHIAKIGWFFLEPSNVILGSAIAGSLLLWLGFRRLGGGLAGLAAGLLLILGLTPASNLLILPLEMRFPVPVLDGRKIDGVVVLGGALTERPTLAHGPAALNESGDRIVAMADLARRLPEARIVFTGGAGVFAGAPLPEGEVLRRKLGEFGLSADRVIIESASVDTHENAALTLELVRPKPGETWLLVTSAWHMPRSVGIFRRQGWPVVAYPVDHRTAGWGDAWRGFWSVSEGLRRADVAMREYVGLLAYRLTGRTAELFPGP